jgi:hypothetical protein
MRGPRTFPQPALVQAWIAFHAGEFERAARLGLDVGVNGYAVAHKAICMYTNYLEPNDKKRLATFECVAERCERQQLEQPGNPAGYYWHAYALGQYSQGISVVKALAQGLGAKVKRSLDMASSWRRSAPMHIAWACTMPKFSTRSAPCWRPDLWRQEGRSLSPV